MLMMGINHQETKKLLAYLGITAAIKRDLGIMMSKIQWFIGQLLMLQYLLQAELNRKVFRNKWKITSRKFCLPNLEEILCLHQ